MTTSSTGVRSVFGSVALDDAVGKQVEPEQQVIFDLPAGHLLGDSLLISGSAVVRRSSAGGAGTSRALIERWAAAGDWESIAAYAGARVLPVGDVVLWQDALAAAGAEIVDLIELHRSTCGLAVLSGRTYFFKVVPSAVGLSEIGGYLDFLCMMMCPKLCWILPAADRFLLGYEYIPGLGLGKQSLGDEIIATDAGMISSLRTDTEQLAEMLEYALSRTVSVAHAPVDELFRRRAAERLPSWYLSNDDLPLLDDPVAVNGLHSAATTREIMAETAEFFRKRTFRTCAPLHGDFNDTNFGSGPVAVDFALSGLNDVEGEVACQFWTLFFGRTLYPRYHSPAYTWRLPQHPRRDLVVTEEPGRDGVVRLTVDYVPSAASCSVLAALLDVASRWSRQSVDFRNLAKYIVLRITTVLDLRTMSPEEQLFCVAMMHWIWALGERALEVLYRVAAAGRFAPELSGDLLLGSPS